MKIIVACLGVIFLTLLFYRSSETKSPALSSPQVLSPKTNLPAANKPTTIRLPQNLPTNPVLDAARRQCEEAKSLINRCNLCQEKVDQEKNKCEADKAAILAHFEEQCNQSLAAAQDQGMRGGFQEGINYVKQNSKDGYVFQLMTSFPNCEEMCSHITGKNQRLMTCIGSVTTEYGCLADVLIHMGPCTGHGENAQCICVEMPP